MKDIVTLFVVAFLASHGQAHHLRQAVEEDPPYLPDDKAKNVTAVNVLEEELIDKMRTEDLGIGDLQSRLEDDQGMTQYNHSGRQLQVQRKRIRINFYKLRVHTTPNDAGSWEEWRMKFRLYILNDKGHAYSYLSDFVKTYLAVREKRSGDYSINVDLDLPFYAPPDWLDATSNPSLLYYLEVYGDEDDKWPDADDTLPNCNRILDFYGNDRIFKGERACSCCGRAYTIYYEISEYDHW